MQLSALAITSHDVRRQYCACVKSILPQCSSSSSSSSMCVTVVLCARRDLLQDDAKGAVYAMAITSIIPFVNGQSVHLHFPGRLHK